MRIVIEMELEVKIPKDRANVNQIFMAVQAAMAEARSRAATKAIEGCEEQIIETLCGGDGRQAKRRPGAHHKRGEGKRRRHRTFRRAGRWSDERTLYGGDGIVVGFRLRTVQCVGCGRRIAPILEALERWMGTSAQEQSRPGEMESILEKENGPLRQMHSPPDSVRVPTVCAGRDLQRMGRCS